jgi:glycine/D-amino acid oxidase-like deaminating enzyme
VVATHFPFIDAHGFYFTKLFQVKSFIIAYKNVPHLVCTYVDSATDGLYFRSYGEYMLVGGGTRHTGKTCCSGYENITAFMKLKYPQAEKVCRWSAQDCKSLDGVPYIGEYGKGLPNVYVASGFNEWGMTSSLISAKILSDMITGKQNEFAPAFSPRRTSLRPQLFKNLGVTLCNFLRPTFKRCSHLGCALTFNKFERVWECACHGSSFSENGHIINNPATHDAKI